jgi:leader peptidase (prepilin peptidase)/N-methyltransferase
VGVEVVIAIVAGLIVGSFLNVCIFRVPLDLSVVRPGSSCPHCGAAIRWYDNIPILGFVLLAGRCRDCSERISFRYPAVEILTAMTFVAIELAGFAPHITFLYWALASAYIVIAVIDIDYKIIPDVISLPSLTIAPAVAFIVMQLTPSGAHGVNWLVHSVSGYGTIGYSLRLDQSVESLVGILVGGGIIWGIAAGYELIRKQEGMGFGDVKLMAMIGGFQGWQAAVFALVIGSMLGTIVGVIAMIAKRGRLDMEIPFGPFLVAGAMLHLLGGPKLIAWYFGLT